MKTTFKLLSIFSLLFVLGTHFSGCENEPFENVANSINLNNPTDSIYVFPVTPGTKMWFEFETNDEKINSCQIPANTLKNLTTEGLIKTCLSYPLLLDLFAYDNLQDGFNALLVSFNGFQELINRKDVAKELVRYYKSIKPSNIEYENDVSYQSYKLMVLELFLSCETTLNRLNESEKNELLSLCVEKHAIMSQNPEEYGLYSCISQGLVIYRILETVSTINLKDADLELGFFIQNGNLPYNQDILLDSYEKAAQYLNTVGYDLNEKVLKSATACTPSKSTVKTPKGSSVEVLVFSCEPLSSAQIKASNNYYKSAYPKAVLLSSASAKYNCHSFAWYSQSTSNYRWMNDPTKFWSDGSYSMMNMCAPDLIWTYGGKTHSAIAKSYNSLPLRSKWGPQPLMAHNYNDCPYSGTLRSYKKN